MRDPTLSEMRELARRSRATHRAGAAAILVGLLAAPLALAFGVWASLFAVLAGGVLMVWCARLAGQERGAYRALFRRLKQKSVAPSGQ